MKEVGYKENWEIMENKNKISKQTIRFLFFSLSSLITYILSVQKLFREEDFLSSWIFFCILFIELIFLSIDVRWVKKRIMWGVLLLLGIILCLLVPNPAWQVLTSIWLSLITIGCLLVFLRDYFDDVREISRLTYFTRWGYIFTLLTSITYWFAILWINTKFPFQCEQISHINESILKSTVSWWIPNEIEIKQNDDMLQINMDNNADEITWENIDWENNDTTIIKEARNIFRKNMVDWFIQTKDSINNKVCEAIVSQIDQIYQNPVFQVWAVFWMYLLFYWVIRIFVWVVTVLWYIIFSIAKFFWLYKIEKKEAIVEDVL